MKPLYLYEYVDFSMSCTTNLSSTQYWHIEICISEQYSVIYCTCDITELKCENVWNIDIVGPNIAKWIEILPNLSHFITHSYIGSSCFL